MFIEDGQYIMLLRVGEDCYEIQDNNGIISRKFNLILYLTVDSRIQRKIGMDLI